MEAIYDSTGVSNVVRLLYRAPYCNILMLARFKENISLDSLNAALEKVLIKFPLLRASIQQNSNGNTRFSFDSVSAINVIQYPKNDENEWLELAWNEQKKPFDLQNGPLIKFLLLNSMETSDLVIICHHAICDGLSLVYLVKNIAMFLRNKDIAIEPYAVPPSLTMRNLSVKTSPGIAVKIFLSVLNALWRKNQTLFSEKDYEILYNQYWQTKNIQIDPLTLSKSLTKSLIDKCHKEKVTVNSAITTALAFSQYDLQGMSKPYLKKALLAINIRHLFENNPKENIGLLALGAQIDLPARDKFWNSARKFSGNMKKILSNPKYYLKFFAPLDYIESSFIDSVYFTAHGVFKNKISNILKNLILTPDNMPKRSLDITNLGSINIENIGNLDTIKFVPILSSNYEKTIGIVTVNGEMHIMIMHDPSQINADTIDIYRKKIIEYIENEIKN